MNVQHKEMMVVTPGRESFSIFSSPSLKCSATKSYLREKLTMLTDGKA